MSTAAQQPHHSTECCQDGHVFKNEFNSLIADNDRRKPHSMVLITGVYINSDDNPPRKPVLTPWLDSEYDIN